MSPEVKVVADEMCQQFWQVILNDKSQLETGFLKVHDNIGQFARPHILPNEHFNERLKALNAMQAFGVFKLELENEWDMTDPLEPFPTGECLYRIIDFDSPKLIEFCSEYGIVLRDNPNVHFAMLEIGRDNIPTIIIKSEKYTFNKMAQSTICSVMKIAINSPNKPFSISELNRLGNDPEVIKTILGGKAGGKGLLVAKKERGFIGDYVRNLKTVPQELLYFFDFGEDGKSIKYIMPTELDDAQLKKILETAHKSQ